ncbi:MAG TPA: DUF433 domain-containing protein [Gemmata sp.]|jgi:uncharacterized protein (DUF433 family)|nr:DUF433 domain-containing protein [Gemmata sp.]
MNHALSQEEFMGSVTGTNQVFSQTNQIPGTSSNTKVTESQIIAFSLVAERIHKPETYIGNIKISDQWVDTFGHSNADLNSSEPLNSLIQHSPGVVGGAAKIRQTRIPVWLLVQLREELEMKDVDIKNYFEPPLTDADLAAAWKYYDDNKKEIDDAIERNEAE